MPDKNWFEKNKKIQTYAPVEIHEHFERWKKERRVKSSSAALLLILQDYFGIAGIAPDLPLQARVEALEARITALEGASRETSSKQGELPGLSDFFKAAHEKHYPEKQPRLSGKNKLQ